MQEPVVDVQLSNGSLAAATGDWLVVPIAEEPQLTGTLGELDGAVGETLGRLIEAGDLTGKLAETVSIHDVPGIEATRLMVVGVGKTDELTRAKLNQAVSTCVRSISSKEDRTVSVALPDALGGVTATDAVETIATSLHVSCVGQDALKTEPGHFGLASATILVGETNDDLQTAASRGSILGEAVNLTRKLVNDPPEYMYPESFADEAVRVSTELGLKCTVLDEDQLRAEKMGSLLGVAQGSDRPPRLVSIEYKGGGSDAETLAIVGKGVTFDSGGLSIKPSDGMITMKCDMAGAATVLGAISAIAQLQLPVNVTGYMGLVENMISGNSYKLGDILTARNGVTIEVQNTDAEGRLVLADVLSYAVDQGASRIIDLATLTGACVVALGEEVTGVFANDQTWCDSLLAAASKADEDAWQLPMFDFYSELLKSDVADCRNIGGRWGGAITAAKFLEKFVSETPWIHLDIAGPSFAGSNKPHREGGATGCMVRTLVETAANLSD
jgi:leucyl aminopeptidase